MCGRANACWQAQLLHTSITAIMLARSLTGMRRTLPALRGLMRADAFGMAGLALRQRGH